MSIKDLEKFKNTLKLGGFMPPEHFDDCRVNLDQCVSRHDKESKDGALKNVHVWEIARLGNRWEYTGQEFIVRMCRGCQRSKRLNEIIIFEPATVGIVFICRHYERLFRGRQTPGTLELDESNTRYWLY